MPRNPLFFAAFAISFAIVALPAAADNYKDCEQTADRDLQIRGCSAILERRLEAPANRAIAYHNRGLAYRREGEYDRAIADLNRARPLARGRLSAG